MLTIHVQLMPRLSRVEHTAICLNGVQRAKIFFLTVHGVGGTRNFKHHPYITNAVFYQQTQLSETKRFEQYLLKSSSTSADKFNFCVSLHRSISQIKHQLDATLCNFIYAESLYMFRASSAHHHVSNVLYVHPKRLYYR